MFRIGLKLVQIVGLKLVRIVGPIVFAISVCGTAQALTVRGYGSIIWVPVVVNSATFTSQIYIHNPQTTTINYAVSYYGGIGTPNPGLNVCPNFAIAADTTAQYSLPSLCSNLTFGPSSNYGSLYIYELDPANKPFSVFVRVQSAQDHGFSIEGFPVGEIDNTIGFSYVNGVERVAASPGYQTNCFVGALQEPVDVTYGVRSSTGALIGTDQPLTLGANDFRRILDVFSAVGAPAGDYTNARVVFSVPTGNASYIGFCTVQNNTTFDADFRIAKVFDDNIIPNDESREFTTTVTVISGTTADLANNVIPTLSTTNQHEWATYIRHPDWVHCAVTSSPANSVELRLKDPSGSVVVGDNTCEPGYGSFPETYLGAKSTRNSGVNGQWLVEVSGCGTPANYTLTCTGGNGLSTFTYGGTQPNEF